MTTTGPAIVDVMWASRAVTCPKCKAKPGLGCMSTGGGNPAQVATHAVRDRRVRDWSDEFAAEAGQLAKSVAHKSWLDWSVTIFDRFEAAAKPSPSATVKQSTPRGVRLPEAQAEEIEGYVLRGGHGHVSTAHFSGDAQHRQTVNALEGKDIVRFVELTSDGYDRRMELTPFGWQVYRQNRAIIRRLSEAEVDALEAAASGVEPAVAA